MPDHTATDEIEALAAQTYRLVLAGGLLEQAGLLDKDPATVLGGLTELARTLDTDPEAARRFKEIGDKLLGDRPAAPVRLSHPGTEPDHNRGHGKTSIPHG